jgi:hypothetical protein
MIKKTRDDLLAAASPPVTGFPLSFSIATQSHFSRSLLS